MSQSKIAHPSTASSFEFFEEKLRRIQDPIACSIAAFLECGYATCHFMLDPPQRYALEG